MAGCAERLETRQGKRRTAQKDEPHAMGIIAPPVNGYHVGVKDLPPAVRPRERLQARGASDLSDAELLAIIVRTGTPSCTALELSTRALARHGGLAGVDRAGLDELCAHEGLGPSEALAIKAALELEQEQLRVLLLNTKNQVLAAPELYRGHLADTGVSTFRGWTTS
jgi:DNA repair protein RadC